MTTTNVATQHNSSEPALYIALELSQMNWKLGMCSHPKEGIWVCSLPPGDRSGLQRQIRKAKKRFGLSGEAPIYSCYEAGRDGFWVHRWLSAQGIHNRVVDSSSIPVTRQARRAKSDGLDVRQLVSLLVRYHWGDREGWKEVTVPSPQDEDDRHLHREIATLRQDRARHVSRIRALLATQGVRVGSLSRLIPSDLEQKLRCWQGRPFRPGLCRRLACELRMVRQLEEQIRELEQELRDKLQEGGHKQEMVRTLMRLRALGAKSSWTFVMEIFGCRQFRNQRQVGSAFGMVPTPYSSGNSHKDQGISRAGNRWCRRLAVEIAWLWIRHQPRSHLTLWFQQRFAQGGKRTRKKGIVAVARKLMIQLWHFVCHGVIPEGAILDPA